LLSVSFVACTANCVLLALSCSSSVCRARSVVIRLLVFFLLLLRPPPISTLFPYTTLFRSGSTGDRPWPDATSLATRRRASGEARSEEHTSELQSPDHLVCRLLLEKKKTTTATTLHAQQAETDQQLPTEPHNRE